jgi:hypothetical protein
LPPATRDSTSLRARWRRGGSGRRFVRSRSRLRAEARAAPGLVLRRVALAASRRLVARRRGIEADGRRCPWPASAPSLRRQGETARAPKRSSRRARGAPRRRSKSVSPCRRYERRRPRTTHGSQWGVAVGRSGFPRRGGGWLPDFRALPIYAIVGLLSRLDLCPCDAHEPHRTLGSRRIEEGPAPVGSPEP